MIADGAIGQLSGDFAHIDPVYFSTSAAGGKAPVFGGKEASLPLQDASSVDALKQCEIIITCHHRMRAIDSSHMKMAAIIRSPSNGRWARWRRTCPKLRKAPPTL